MKAKLSITLTLALLLLVFAGCQSANPGLYDPGVQQTGGEQTVQEKDDGKVPAQANEPEAGAAQEKTITADEAKKIAVEHAGLKVDQVTGLRVENDLDDGVAHYDVDFRFEDYDYDYEVDAKTGAVLSTDKEYEPVVVQSAATQQQSDQDANAPQQTTQSKLTEKEAQAAALKHAGLKESEVTGLRAVYEVDDGVAHYDVDFRKGDYDYDYEIHAKTGAVLSSDRDYDPVKTQGAAAQKPAEAKLTAEEAKQIALKHAGLKESEVTRLRVEYDVDDGVAQYEVEFQQGKFEYSYEIHAESGKILQSEKDWDD